MLNIKSINAENFSDVPKPCRYCLYWKATAPFEEKSLTPEMEVQKREWFKKVSEEFGPCGLIAYFNHVPLGFVHYGPSEFFPRVKEYASGPPSENSVFLACLYIADKEMRGRGLGTALLENLIDELRGRGFRAIETFARKSSHNNPSGPLRLYLKLSFEVVSNADDFPLVRLNLGK